MSYIRRIVLTLVALAILSPFLLMALALLRHPAPANAAPIQDSQLAQFMSTGRAPDTARRHPTAPIQLAGTKDSLWLMIPQQSTDGKTDYFKLWAHAGGDKVGVQDVWNAIHDQNGILLPRLPAFLTVQVPPFDDAMPSSAVVFYDDGRLIGYSPATDFELPYLPDRQRPFAVAGGGDRGERTLLVLTRGPRIATTQPSTAPATQPLETPASASAPSTASAPATSAATTPSGQWNLLRRVNTKWLSLPDPTSNGPSPEAHIVMTAQQDLLWLLWYEPGQLDLLHAKSLNWRASAGGWNWSATIDTKIPEPMTRLQIVTIPQMVLLWPVKQADKATFALHGITLSNDGKVDTDPKGVHMVSFDLGDASKDILPERDIAVSQFSNSIAVIIAAKDDSIQQLLFTPTGVPNGPAVKVDPNQTSPKATPGMEQVRIAVLMGLMALSFWYWRRQPTLLALPKGVKMAALGQRIAAGLVDMSLPMVVVVLGFQLYDTDKFTVAREHLSRAFALDFSTPPVELLWFIGIYLAHVTTNEIVNGRSLGKVIFGLAVVGLDGKRAKPAQIVLRNVSRLAEWLAVVPIFAPAIPPLRQRVGDILARTLVVQMHTLPPGPIDPDDEKK